MPTTPEGPGSTPTHSVNLVSAMINIDYQENFIIIASVLAIIYGILNAYLVLRIKVTRDLDKSGREVDDENENIRTQLSSSKLREMEEISRLIREGAHTFLKTQYISISIFCAIFAVIIACVVEKEKYTYYENNQNEYKKIVSNMKKVSKKLNLDEMLKYLYTLIENYTEKIIV